MDHDYCPSGKRKNPVEDEVTADSGFQFPEKKLRDDTYTPLDFNFGRDFCLSHCETIQEEEPPCKTVQQEVTDSFSELGIENEPKIPLVETLNIEKHILASKGIQDSCSDDYDLNCEQFKGICSSYMASLSIGSDRGSYFIPKKIPNSEFVNPKKSLLCLAYPKKSLSVFCKSKFYYLSSGKLKQIDYNLRNIL